MKINIALGWFWQLLKFFLFEWHFVDWPWNAVILLGFQVPVPYFDLIFGICDTCRCEITWTFVSDSSLVFAFFREKHCVLFSVLRILPEWRWFVVDDLPMVSDDPLVIQKQLVPDSGMSIKSQKTSLGLATSSRLHEKQMVTSCTKALLKQITLFKQQACEKVDSRARLSRIELQHHLAGFVHKALSLFVLDW